MAQITITLTKDMAAQLWDSGCDFDKHWEAQEYRFEIHDRGSDDPFDGVDSTWGFYWSATAADHVLLQAYFASEGIPYRVFWDLDRAEMGYDDSHVTLAAVSCMGDYWKETPRHGGRRR